MPRTACQQHVSTGSDLEEVSASADMLCVSRGRDLLKVNASSSSTSSTVTSTVVKQVKRSKASKACLKVNATRRIRIHFLELLVGAFVSLVRLSTSPILVTSGHAY